MKPPKTSLFFFTGLLIFTLAFYFILYFTDVKKTGSIAVSIIPPIVALYYIFFIQPKSFFITSFLMLAGLSNLIMFLFYTLVEPKFISFAEEAQELFYAFFIVNGLVLLSNFSLVLDLSFKMKFSQIWKKFKIHLFVLLVLGIYVVYVKYSSVILPDILYRIFELVFNINEVVLFILALINYFYSEDKKSFYFFLGALMIVFQDLLGIVYNVLNQDIIFSVLYITFNVASFYFLVAQTLMISKKESMATTDFDF